MEINKETLSQELLNNIQLAKQIMFSEWRGTLCVRIEALDKQDYPHNIQDNGFYLDFNIDLLNNKVEFDRSGHVYLSPSDLKTDKYKYLAMRSLSSFGEKKFRKCMFKSEKDLIDKISIYANNIFKSLHEYTGGYPYLKGIN